MIYRSNLEAPDLSRYFPYQKFYPRPWSFTHDVPSDQEFDPDCGSFTLDETAILYHCAKARGGTWVDIGARFGWTTAHICEAGCHVHMVDPALSVDEYENRRAMNLLPWFKQIVSINKKDSGDFFDRIAQRSTFSGFLIDGNHDEPFPFTDAVNSVLFAKPTCCIILHDFWGKPIRDAVQCLLDRNWSARVYYTPNGIAVCWRGDFIPPDHVPDRVIKEAMTPNRFPDFDFRMLS
jgi:hypothetical protein